MNAQELAEELGVAERTVRRWIAQGRLRAERRGRAFVIDPAAVEAALDELVPRRAAPRAERAEQDAAYAELRGRFALLREMYEQLQDQLADERRRVARLELELEQHRAAAA
jgi:excisionase family DNA binding protein